MGLISKTEFDALMGRIERERIRLRSEFALLQHGEQALGMAHRPDGDGVVFQQRMIGLDEMERKLRAMLRPNSIVDRFMTGNRQVGHKSTSKPVKSAVEPYHAGKGSGYILPDGAWKARVVDYRRRTTIED